MLTRCPDETMVAWQAWRRGRRLAQRYRHGAGKRAHKGRSGHGEDEAAPGLVSIDVADESPLLSEIPATWLFVSSKKERCKSSQR